MSLLTLIVIALFLLAVMDILVILALCRAADLADRQLGYK